MSDRWLKVTLLISVALNFLIIGAIAGFLISGAPDARPFPPHLGWIVRHVDPQTRQTLKPLLMQYHRDSQDALQHMKRAQQQVNQLIVANPMDPMALSKSLEDLRSVSAESQTLMHRAMIDILGQLDSEQRQQVLHSLNRNWRHEMHGPRKGRGPRPPPD
jgi:uncharacterized membrane protein